MKKSTGIVFLLAVVLAALAYFYDWKRHPTTDFVDPNVVQMTFDIKAEDINHIVLTRAGMTVVMNQQADGWHITQPISVMADQAAMDALTHSLAVLPVDRTVPVTPDLLKDYGLSNPVVTIEFTLQNGATHKLVVGGKDFSNLEVYTIVDGGKDATLITNKIVASADKGLDDFRDHSVLPLARDQIASLDLRNKSGEIVLQRKGLSWTIVKPVSAPGDLRAASALVNAVTAARIAKFVSDNAKDVPPADLAKYGLDSPSIRLRVNLIGGQSQELLLGKKDGIEYYAMDPERSMIFRVPDTLYNKLSPTFADLQARVLYTARADEITRIAVRTQKGTTDCIRNESGSLVIEPVAKSSAAAALPCPDYVSPLETARATKLYGAPSETMQTMLAKPAITVTLTSQAANSPNNPSGSAEAVKKTEIQISAASGNSLYARTSIGPTVYEFGKHAFDALSGGAPLAK